MTAGRLEPHPTLADERVLAVLSPANLRRLDEIRQHIGAVFPRLDVIAPDDLVHLGEAVKRSAPTHSLILAVGGDGTLHHCLRHLDLSRQALGLVPGGTGNDFARGIGFSDGISTSRAARLLRDFTVQPSDLCQVNGVRYLNSAGFGLDTETVKVRESSSGLLHRNYTLAFLAALQRMAPVSMRYSYLPAAPANGAAEHHREEDWVQGEGEFYWVLAMNNRDIGKGTKIAPRALIDDGLLDMVLVKAVPKLQLLAMLPGAIKGRHLSHDCIDFCHVRELHCEILSTQRMLAVDGESYPLAQNKVDFSVSSGGLKLLRPAQ